MPSFVVETYVPAEGREQFTRSVEALRAAAAGTDGAGRVRHLRSLLMPGDEMGFHVLEADSAADAERLTAAVGIEIERVVEVLAVDVPSTEGVS